PGVNYVLSKDVTRVAQRIQRPHPGFIQTGLDDCVIDMEIQEAHVGDCKGQIKPSHARAGLRCRAGAVMTDYNWTTQASLGRLDGYNEVMERPGATTLKGNPLTVLGPELKPGDAAPDFEAINDSLQPVNLKSTGGGVRIFSVVPSLDTPV